MQWVEIDFGPNDVPAESAYSAFLKVMGALAHPLPMVGSKPVFGMLLGAVRRRRESCSEEHDTSLAGSIYLLDPGQDIKRLVKVWAGSHDTRHDLVWRRPFYSMCVVAKRRR
jgi:hypothetical protein